MTTAVMTMVYNEAEFLPLWLRYYGSQVARGNLYVIDHGSSDGSTSGLSPANVIRIPRTPQNDRQRSAMIHHFVAGLLMYHDTVIYVDVDEFLVPDPRRHASLAAFCARRRAPVVTAIGLNVIHRAEREARLDPDRPVLAQRRWCRLISSMCKPSVTSRPVRFADGFHGCDHPPVFEDLFLFHLRYFDRGLGLVRLARTRAIEWAGKSGAHQRVDDDQWLRTLNGNAQLPDGPPLLSEAADSEIARFQDAFLAAWQPDARGIHRNTGGRLQGAALYSVPDALSTAF